MRSQLEVIENHHIGPGVHTATHARASTCLLPLSNVELMGLNILLNTVLCLLPGRHNPAGNMVINPHHASPRALSTSVKSAASASLGLLLFECLFVCLFVYFSAHLCVLVSAFYQGLWGNCEPTLLRWATFYITKITALRILTTIV